MVNNNIVGNEGFSEFSPIAIVKSNRDGIIEQVNPKSEQLFGFDAGELVGKPIECLLPESMKEKHVEHRAAYIAEPFFRAMGADHNLVGRKKNGDVFPIEIGLSYARNGDSIEVTSYIIDITERKQSDNISLAQIETEKDGAERELQMAHKVQTSLLPKVIPHIPGWSTAVKWIPANNIGGDFYDVIDRKNDYFDLAIADVTGNSVPAALFMAFANTTLRTTIDGKTTLQDGITNTNQRICQDSSQGLYVTLFMARICAEKGEITFVNAGHTPALHYSKRKGRVSKLTLTGMPLGIDAKTVYQHKSLHIEPMDFIVFYTDGVTETSDPSGNEFGIEGLEKVILSLPNAAPDEIVNAISNALMIFSGNDNPSDDLTIMIAKREIGD